MTRNIKEFNVIILILIATLIIGIAGATSLALFSGETSSVSKITGTVVSPKLPTGAETIIKKVGTGGLVADSHPVTEQLATTTDYRYTGKKPNNYVLFNNEPWRIIGVFDVDDGTGNLEQRIKIIRYESIKGIAWDKSKGVSGINDWSKATGMTLLNSGDYWNRTGSYASKGLTEEAKLMIDDAKWYLGGTDQYNTTNTIQFYGYERGTTVYRGRPTSWVGKVALMYPSDYGYATSGGSTTNRDACLAKEMFYWDDYSSLSDCKNNDWLYDSSNHQWTITPYSGNLYGVFYVNSVGNVNYDLVADLSLAFRPTLYLKSDIKIIGGSGMESDLYQLSL